MKDYTPIYKPNQIACGSGRTVIVTGWTVKESVAKHLDPTEYAGIGNLYSPTRGISPLIRNLLANPHVEFLIILNATKEDRNSGGSQCLLDLWRHGISEGSTDTGKESWVINSSVTGYIDKEIPQEAIDTLRANIQAYGVNDIPQVLALVKRLNQFPISLPWGDPLTFPQVETFPQVLPGSIYGHRIEGKTIAETWVKILHRIKTTGKIRPTGYDGHWQELIDLMAVVTDEPDGFYFPEPNYLPLDRTFLAEYIPQVLADAAKQPGVKYTYGQRLRSWFGVDQIEQVINKLIKEVDAASAVMSLWDVGDHTKGGSPCLNHIWVRVLDGELSLTATFRSNDMFGAWPANAMGLRALQKHICEQINARNIFLKKLESGSELNMGPLITISQSAHIYEETWENVDFLIKSHYRQKQEYSDPVGNFIIEPLQKSLLVTQTTPGSGIAVKTYEGDQPLKLIREIAAANPAISPDHLGYLGIELQKAIDSRRRGDKPYRQDRD